MSQHEALTAEQHKLDYLWNPYLRAKFEARSVDQDQDDVTDPLLNELPVMSGGTGRKSCTNLTPNPHPMKRDRGRTSALLGGLVVTVAAWTLAAAFAPETLGPLSSYSPWFYGPVTTAVWALFSAIAYLLVAHGRDRRPRWI